MIRRLLAEDRKKLSAEADEYGKNVELEVFSGRVASKGEHQRTTRVTTNKDATVVLQTTPEIWVESTEGTERRFVDTTVAECRASHAVTLIISRSNDAVLSMKNHSTGQTLFAPEMSLKPVDAAHYWRVGFSVALFTLLSLLISMLILGDAMERNAWWSGIAANSLQITAIALGVLIPERSRRKQNLKVAALRERIQSELAHRASIP